MKNFIFCFIISIGIHCAAVFATQFDDEWKQTCRKIIGKLSQLPPKSEECADEVNENLNALAKEVDKIHFLCLTNECKPNCDFNKGNSHFLYSLNEAIKNCHEQNAGQNSANNGQNANLAFLQQFSADFNTLVTEIELLIGIGESDLSEMSKEKVKGQSQKLAKLQNDLSKNRGFYNETPIKRANDQLGEILQEKGDNWKESEQLDTEIQQIFAQMILTVIIEIYEKEFDAKLGLIDAKVFKNEEIEAIFGIFQRKFQKFAELLSIVEKKEDFKQMLQKLAVKTLEKASELNADNKLDNLDQFQNAFTIQLKDLPAQDE
ncbi:hypothetical protein niasHT_037444 [Heterodera trifolii]|uniref:Secreted protein n=1 Tax=Heterodera trifolii TaxID=157864 RepID=A0ABD2IKB0_9BILA